MTTIAADDLRNHAAAVLRQVADGADITVTVDGKPVAVLTRPHRLRRSGIPRSEIAELLASQTTDSTLGRDMDWITAGTTDDQDPLR